MVPHFLEETIKKSMDYTPKSFGSHKTLVQTQIPTVNSMRPTVKSRLEKTPYNSGNIIHACHVGSHVDFSSNEDVMGSSPKLRSSIPKVGTRDTWNE